MVQYSALYRRQQTRVATMRESAKRYTYGGRVLSIYVLGAGGNGDENANYYCERERERERSGFFWDIHKVAAWLKEEGHVK